MSRSSFSKAYEEIANLEPMEMTFTINDADLDKLNEILKDINVKECPWFEVQDKHGNKARYYREPRKKGKWIYGEKSGQDGWYCSECGGFIPWYYDFYGLDNIDFIEDFKTCPFCDSKMVSYTGADMKEGEESE